MKRMDRKKKEEIVKTLTEEIKSNKINILASFRNLSVPEMQKLRQEVKKKEGNLKVVKNTLMEIAFKNLSLDEACKFLDGSIILAWTKKDDEISLVKSLIDFRKKVGKIEIKGGILRGEIIQSDYVEGIGKLPGINEIRVSVVSYLKMPIVRVVNSIKFPAVKLVNVINQIKEKKERENGKG